MLNYHTCPNGDEVICGGIICVSVDDVIEFLERHRGKTFYSGALETPCLYADAETLTFEELDYIIECCEDDEYGYDDEDDDDLYEDNEEEEEEEKYNKGRYLEEIFG